MTADIRTAAQREADRRLPGDFSSHLSQYRQGFADGAVWAAERVTPTREQLAEALELALTEFRDKREIPRLEDHLADAILALMQELAEGSE